MLQTHTIIKLGFLCLIVTIAAQSSAAPATQPTDEVASLISDLNATDYSVREIAEHKLAAMGPSIEPQLRQALQENPSDETRARLGHILGQFQETNNLHAHVTLHYKDAPLEKVLDDFAAQAGATLGIHERAVTAFVQGRTVTIDLDNADFWRATRVLCDATGLSAWIGQGAVYLAPPGPRLGMAINLSNPLARICGGVFISPTHLQEERTLNYNQNPPVQAESLTFEIVAVPEPKLRILAALDSDWLKECLDDKGHSMLPPPPPQALARRFDPNSRRGVWWWPLRINLSKADPSATRIATLRGELDGMVQTKVQTLEIDDITRARNVTKVEGDLSLTVIGCTKTHQRLELSIMTHGVSNQDSSLQDFVTSAILLDESGRSCPRLSFSEIATNGGILINTSFLQTPSPAAKLQWERTLEQQKLSIPFEINDLPLPSPQ